MRNLPHGHSPPTERRGRRISSYMSRSAALRFLRLSATLISSMVLFAAVAVFLFLAVGPRLLGYQTSTMLTGSMAPLINPGDVVVTVPTPVNQIRAGDVITYHIPVEDRRVETHRVTELTANTGGSVSVQTKGDANNGPDPWVATFEGETVDVHVATIPHLGSVIRHLRSPVVSAVLMYAAPSLLVAIMLRSIWGRKPKDGSPYMEERQAVRETAVRA